jgi:dTDP-glucose 4,6-dehydratase
LSNIVVTGGFGFIGSNWIRDNHEGNIILIIDNLSKGSNPNNIDSNILYHHINKDICKVTKENIECYFDGKVDYIIHFAAESHVDRSINAPLDFIKTNVLGTANLLNIARELEGVRFIHVSTDEVYGHLELTDPSFTETTPYNPRSPYSASKASSDHIAKAYYETYGLDVIVTNCCNNVGPNQDGEKLVPTVIRNAIQGNPIPVYGNGQNIREWISVHDHNHVISLLMKQGKAGESYCIGSRFECTNLELIEKICTILDSKRPKDKKYFEQIQFVGDRKGHDFRYSIDSTKIENELGFIVNTPLNKTLNDTIDYYLKTL